MSWPLIGRNHELDVVEACRRRGEHAVVVVGPAGVGKSRLAREALARLAQAGAQTRWVQATRSAATVPLGAFAAVLPDSMRSEDPLELLRSSAQALALLGAPGKVVLAVDDAHLLDPSSAALVLELALGGAVFLLLTLRTGEPCEDAVTSLWKDGGAVRVELQALGRADTESLTEEIAGGPVEESARRWVFDTSLGNALYVRELVHGALSGGALVERSGLWRMQTRPPISASLGELIAARLAGLAPTCVRAMELLALGEPLRVSEFVALTDQETLIELEQRGLADISEGAGEHEVALSHPLYGEAIRAELPPFRARQRQLELAETIARRAELHTRDLLRVTQWLTDAGRPVATDVLVQASRAASLSGDPVLGAQLAQHAIAAGAGIDAALALARARILQGRYADADAALRPLEDQIRDRASAISYLEQRSLVLYWGLRRSDELRALLTRARTWWADAEWRQHVDTLGLLSVERSVGAADVAASAETFAQASATPALSWRADPAHAFNLFLDGRVRDAYALARAFRTPGPVVDLADQMRFGLWSRIALESGLDWEEVDDWNAAALADAITTGDHAAAGRAALVLANLRYAEGRFLQAGRLLAEAERHLEDRNAGGLLTLVHSLRVGVACSAGDLPHAVETALERCLEACGGEPLPSELPYVARAQGWASHARGDPPRAQATLLDAAERMRHMPIYAARLSYEAIRAGAAAGRLAPRLQRLAERCDTPLTDAYAAHATAKAEADGGRLLQVSHELEAIGALRYACEAAADAASSHLRAGRHDSGRRAAVRCHDLHAQGENGTPPAIVGLDTDDVALTARERQLTELAARGMSNTEIADQLVLSVRTVESHLYRAMRKLGINDRRQLARAGQDGERHDTRLR